MEKMATNVVAFFDLDRTILSVNSAAKWIQSEFRQGRIGLVDVARAGFWVVRYHFGGDILKAFREAVETLEGQKEEVLRKRTHAFYCREIAGKERPGAVAALESHRIQGHRRVLLTSASNYLAEPAAQRGGLDAYLCTSFEVNAEGYFTGEPQEPLCYGAGKLELAQRYLDSHGGQLSDAYFYTDSMSDVEMLEAVGNPVVVNPDFRLGRHARSNSWPIVDWGGPL